MLSYQSKLRMSLSSSGIISFVGSVYPDKLYQITGLNLIARHTGTSARN